MIGEPKNMTQIEIEQAFSKAERMKAIQESAEEMLLELDYEDYKEFYALLPEDLADELLVYLFYLLGNPDYGKSSKDIEDARIIDVQSVIGTIAKYRGIISFCPNAEKRRDLAADITFALEEQLYQIKPVKTYIGDNNFRSLPHCIIYFTFEYDKMLDPSYDTFMIPMIEKPLDWTTKQSGGYNLLEERCILRKGENNQPQEVLDVLNLLQSNKYNVSKFSSIDDYKEYLFQKFSKDSSLLDSGKRTLQSYEKTLNKTLSIDQSYQILAKRDFSFEWKFDFRGRMYCVGYDLTLQGDSYQKGVIRPILKDKK